MDDKKINPASLLLKGEGTIQFQLLFVFCLIYKPRP